MKVGKLVKLKVDCLGNPAGTLGVVFYDYGDGFQAIFKNGNYDGFSTVHKMPSGQIEADFFLEDVGWKSCLEEYKFQNVIRLEQDFRAGFFNSAFDERR